MGDAPHFDATQAKHKKEPKKVKLKCARHLRTTFTVQYHEALREKVGWGFGEGDSLNRGQDSPSGVKMAIDRETNLHGGQIRKSHYAAVGTKENGGRFGLRVLGRQKDYNSDSREFEYATFRPVGFCLGIWR